MEQQEIKVSVIVPVYNVELFLPHCLDTIVGQKYSNLDIVLVDDGSTDLSAHIADKYAEKDDRIRVIHKKNEGVSTARNIGIDAAIGDYICFVDGDDNITYDYVTYLLAMVTSQNVDVALTTEICTTFDDLINFNSDGEKKSVRNCRIVTGEEATIELLYYHIPIGCYCKIFKTEFLRKNNIRFLSNVFVGEGFNFNALAFQYASKVAIGTRKVYCYRRDNPASCMTAFRLEKCEMALKAIEILRKNLKIKSDNLYRACDFADWHTHTDMYNWMVLSKVKHKFPKQYSVCLKKAWSYAFMALFMPINRKERFRALVQIIHPRLLAALLEYRRWRARQKNLN